MNFLFHIQNQTRIAKKNYNKARLISNMREKIHKILIRICFIPSFQMDYFSSILKEDCSTVSHMINQDFFNATAKHGDSKIIYFTCIEIEVLHFCSKLNQI